MEPAKVTVRVAIAEDLAAINYIYNHYVNAAHFTFDIEPISFEARRDWFADHGTRGRYRVLAALSEREVVGFASSSRFRPKPAYETSVETSIYLAPEMVARGVGFRLYEKLFKLLAAEDVHRAYAGIALPNPGSIALHERFGFRRVAHFSEQGRKFGKYWDVDWYEKSLGREVGG